MYFVRTAGERDLDAIVALIAETWHATYDAPYGAEKVESLLAGRATRDIWASRLDRRHGEFLLADNGVRIGGLAFATTEAADATVVTLHHIYVRPAIQRQGIGRDLFAEIETCFPNANRLRAEVYTRNVDAIAFFAVHGMSQVGAIDGEANDGSGLAAFIMEKRLLPH